MYKKSLKSMPRSIKKELVKRINLFQSMTDIIPISQAECAYKEKEMVEKLSKIRGLPSYWLVSSKANTDYFYVVFESRLSFDCETKFLYGELIDKSYSPYYGIY